MIKIITIILIALGAIIMFLSIVQTKKIFRLIKENKYRILWKILSYLMFFFFLGYLVITVLLQFDIGDFLFLLMGLIFFFGALFVYVVVKTGYLTINDLLKTTLFNLELQKSKETSEAIAQTKSQFLATMSHEIRTPMSAIIAMANLLLKTDLNSEQKDFVETIQTSGDTLLIILNDILDFSRIESGKIELEYQCFNLSDCLEKVIDLMAIKAYESGLEIIYFIHSDVPQLIITDSNRLKQILLNLITNAIKFTPSGEILITIKNDETEENKLIFSVKDTGIGIEKEKFERLFQAFSQVDSSHARRFGGTGLGLTISQKLIELMGGEIWCESEVNQGSTFSFTIKFNPEISPINILPLEELKYRQVLIASNNLTSQKILKEQLENWRLITYISNLDNIALKIEDICKNHQLNLIILDLPINQIDTLNIKDKVHQICLDKKISLLVYEQPGKKENKLKLWQFNKPIKYSKLKQQLINIFAKNMNVFDKITTNNIPIIQVNNQIKILVAEDNIVNQKIAKAIFKQLGYSINIANNGLEVLKMLEKEDYDLIFMDIQMPEMDGLETTREILKEYSVSKKLPKIIAITANAMPEDREICLKAGMNDYITKPIKVEEIEKVIDKWI